MLNDSDFRILKEILPGCAVEIYDKLYLLILESWVVTYWDGMVSRPVISRTQSISQIIQK